MEVKGVITDAPSNRALLTDGAGLIGLTLDAKVHNMVATDGTVLDDYIPRPEGNGVPLLNLKSWLSRITRGSTLGDSFSLLWRSGSGSILHINVGHGD